MNNLPGSGNSLVGDRDDDNSPYLPDDKCICTRCQEIVVDATDDGEGFCELCLQIIIEQQQEALELSQQIQFEMIWEKSTVI